MAEPQTDSHMTYSKKQADQYDFVRRSSPAIILQIANALHLGSPDSSTNILDVGCGTGNYLIELRNWCFHYLNLTGVDVSKDMVAKALEKTRDLGIAITQMDMRELQFENNSFDGLYLVHSLHHCGGNLSYSAEEIESHRRRALSELYRVLGPGGKLIIIQSDPWQNEANALWGTYFPWALEKKKIIQPTSESIRKWMRDVGFENVQVHTFHDYLTRPVFSPEMALEDEFLATYSEFSYLTPDQLKKGRVHLQADIDSGMIKNVINASQTLYSERGGNFTAVIATKPGKDL